MNKPKRKNTRKRKQEDPTNNRKFYFKKTTNGSILVQSGNEYTIAVLKDKTVINKPKDIRCFYNLKHFKTEVCTRERAVFIAKKIIDAKENFAHV